MKGPSLALLIGPKMKGKGAPSEKDEAPESESEDSESSEKEYGDMLASMAGVSDDDKADFVDALSGFVRACMRKDDY